jgi:hypothetical protein
MNDNNANITNNYVYGDSDAITSLAYINNHIINTPDFGARSKILIQGNNIEINRSSYSVNTTFAPLGINSTNIPSTATYFVALASGNNFQSPILVAPTQTYTVAPTDEIIIAPTAAGSVVINLPPVSTSLGRKITIKDPGYATTMVTITINANGSDTFDGSASPLVIENAKASVTLVAYQYNGVNAWFDISLVI